MAIATLNQAQEYVNGLTLDNEGLPPISEDPKNVSQLLAHGIQVGRDAFTMERFLRWTEKRTESMTQAAAARNPFGASEPCPLSEAEFEKHAPEKIHCLFLSDSEWSQLTKAFPTGIGQPLRSMKKAGEPKPNPKTGTFSGGRYKKSGSFGYFLSGVVVIQVELPGRGVQIINGRPTINMAIEGSKDPTKAVKVNYGAQEGAGDEEEELEEKE